MFVTKYKAKKVDGNEIIGIYTGDDFYSFVRMLRTEGYFIISVRKTMQLCLKDNKLNSKDLWLFTSEFSEILSAGINIDLALSLLIDMSTNKTINKSLFQIKSDVDSGSKLQNSLNKFSNIYPEFLINMVGIGEASGNLEIILKNLSEFYKKEWELKQKIKGVMTYPVIVIIFTILSIFIIMNNVLPKMVDVILSLGGDIPTYTKFMLKINSIFLKHKIIIVSAMVLLILYFKKKKINILKKLLVKIPYIKQIYIDTNISKLSANLSLLLHSGINIIDSLRLLESITANVNIKKEIIKCINEINNGNSLLEGINKTSLDRGLLHSMISLGESTGNLDKMLLKTSEIIDENNQRKTKKLLSFLEPFLIMLLTLIVGAMIISILIPMLNVMDSIK